MSSLQYGNAAATALEDCPEEARGLMSGVYQSGYPFGYLLATVFWKAFDDKTPHGWRPLFWFGAGPPVLLIIFRLCLSETDAYNKRHNSRNEKGTARGAIAEVKIAVRLYWQRLIYLVLFMAGFNYMVSPPIVHFHLANIKRRTEQLTPASLTAHRISSR